MDPLKLAINELNEWEARTILYDLLKEAEGLPDSDLSGRLLKLWNDRKDEARLRHEEAERIQKNVHITFSLSDAGSLKVALSELGNRQENKVLAFDESFSIGPIVQLDIAAGRRTRQHWMMERFSPCRMMNNQNREHQIENMIEEFAKIPADKTIHIWCANNAHDQTGLRLTMYLLRHHQQPIKLINFTEILHDSPVPPIAQAFVGRDMHREIVKNCHRSRTVTLQERQQYVSSWEKLSLENNTLRLWQDGEIKGCKCDELDGIIKSAVMELQAESDDEGFIKAGKVVSKMFESLEQVIDDSFIEYRIWILISNGVFTFRGLPGALHQFSIKRTTPGVN
ncbi:DUF1835 domain-containing protein [Paenibacillus glycanilyticus]|uniref:DUF1835 domain-containing protein n=1 Tax=Paenibacillus glycanilyticus TaxID=126569 RepID=UPI00203E25EC|nr:DUF1835 domain-containing protein [Paenibacillus glycanilyticus]